MKSLRQTERQYVGVTEGLTDLNLLVGCWGKESDPARADVITRAGDVVRNGDGQHHEDNELHQTVCALVAVVFWCLTGRKPLCTQWT